MNTPTLNELIGRSRSKCLFLGVWDGVRLTIFKKFFLLIFYAAILFGGTPLLAESSVSQNTPAVSSEQVIPANSEEGMRRLERAEYKADFFPLVNNFESQINDFFCGPTSATIVMNALGSKNGRLTQDTFFNGETEKTYRTQSRRTLSAWGGIRF